MNELFRVEHCRRIICAIPPDICPICKNTIVYEDIPPTVSLMNLITNGHGMQGALVILLKPTRGKWSPTTQHKGDLHIGVSDTHGGVLNYSESGLIVDKSGWEHCVIVYEVPRLDAKVWQTLWIRLIDELLTDMSWSAMAYDETTYNCFDFAIWFLKSFKNQVKERCGELDELNFLTDHSDMHDLKNIFVNNFVLTKLKAAADQIRLEHDVAQHGFAIA